MNIYSSIIFTPIVMVIMGRKYRANGGTTYRITDIMSEDNSATYRIARLADLRVRFLLRDGFNFALAVCLILVCLTV